MVSFPVLFKVTFSDFFINALARGEISEILPLEMSGSAILSFSNCNFAFIKFLLTGYNCLFKQLRCEGVEIYPPVRPCVPPGTHEECVFQTVIREHLIERFSRFI
jgi:hypothetical protein